MKEKIIKEIEKSLKKNNFNSPVELINSKNYGDFSTNIAFKLASKLKINPQIIAKKIINHIKSPLIKEVKIENNGFINIFVNNTMFVEQIKNILMKNKNYGKIKQNKYINVEYVSANPTGHLHIGHARGAAIGSSLVNVLKFAGNKVDSEYYINDMGNQIDVLGTSVFVIYNQKLGANMQLPEESYKAKEIHEVADKFIKEYGDSFLNKTLNEEILTIFKKKSQKYLLNVIKEHLLEYRVKIEIYSSEKKIYELNKIENTLINIKDFVYKKDGALWLKTTAKGDDKDRVLIKSDGSYPYFTPDLAFHNLKASRGYDKMIDVLGVDHVGYIKRMQVGLECLKLPKDILEILKVQTVKLVKNNQELKMSKRKGTSFTLKNLIDEVGIDVARWFMIDRASNSEFIFNIDKAKKQSKENPVFSVQYSYARTCQLLNKSQKNPNPTDFQKNDYSLINILNKFPEIIKVTAISRKINLLTQYLSQVSKKFNSWYTNNKIIGEKRESSLLSLALATKIVLKNGLDLLLISTPDKM